MRPLMISMAFLLLVSCSQKTQPAATKAPAEGSVKLVSDEPKARNVIFLIGDGMGLAQITAGMYLNNNKTALEGFPVVGLHKSHSYNKLVTDSAAGATAFASGVKTVNGAVGVDHMGITRETILEEAERKDLATGLVATSTIVHATPAAFIAHVPNRRLYEEIALDFMQTEIDLMIGGGKAFFTRRDDGRDLYKDMRKNGYYVADYLDAEIDKLEVPGKANVAYFTADKDPLPHAQGRDYLVPATKFTLEFLSGRSPEGFFVMIEGSQIDWGGHANNAEYIVDEFLEFDKVIKLCLDYAKKDGETLVIVTADHETGGFAINPESTMRELETAFTTGGHTATLIPVFAYGPGAEEFSGMYDNTEIYHKMRKAFGWRK